jgi:hypothetical protein
VSARLAEVFSILRAKRPPPVGDWLEANIQIPPSWGPAHGRVRFTGREYQRRILDLCHPESGVTDVVISSGTQITKTSAMLLGMAYRMVWVPQASLVVMPSMDFAKTFLSEQRLIPLIESNPVLAALKPAAEDDFKMLHLAMAGGNIDIVGTNSPTNLSGRTVANVYQDEVCKFEFRERSSAPEAHPMLLADHRAKLFGSRAFRWKSSSPNIPGHPFWRGVEQGTQTVFAVPCPHCREWFNFDWVYKDADSYASVVWDKLAKGQDGQWDLDRVLSSAHYVCPANGCRITDGDKPGMIRQCEEKHLNPGASRRHRSFIIPSFYSPAITFGEIACKWIGRDKDLFRSGTRDFLNGWAARPYTEIEVTVEDADVRSLICPEYARRQLPFVPQSLIIAADPGDTSGVHWMVTAAAENGDIAVIDWGVTLDLAALDDLRTSGKLRYQIGGTDRVVEPAYGLIDSGYMSQMVWDLCARTSWWVPTRGMRARYGAWTRGQVRSHPTLTQFVFVDSKLKDELYDRRMKRKQGPRIMLPADADALLLAQISGQQREARTGYWRELPSDHLGDCLKQAVLDQWIRSAVWSTVDSVTST